MRILFLDILICIVLGEGMLEGHLVVHLNEKLKGDKQCLQLQKVCGSSPFIVYCI